MFKPEKVEFPFIAVTTPDMCNNTMSLNMDNECQQLHLKLAKPI